ncbi:uncharacterized protein LACBIDRAFT_311336 [Laccaria bicolor S238N-H82]|uniref:Predicted protein n=1 Tax=Laccaria bicolor (strain S238N-H82 / ATCC MYA-4686) TaxID=486041 RepID=B0CZS0_LACBS|nr:uncharacterized protein LACBIDRAFT_311336 [Laccaria bicolor S238N-H82]EDR12201.1 predicted protein [Laccaria bicolor S238N-H82]|eukprot:XP_001876465.1 predicted protein [Laccaria bicolor S238N-H82]
MQLTGTKPPEISTRLVYISKKVINLTASHTSWDSLTLIAPSSIECLQQMWRGRQ